MSSTGSTQKPILAIDFDGVIHRYSNGWQGGEIYDEAVPGFFLWFFEAVEKFKIVIVSSRLNNEDARPKMAAWLMLQALAAREREEITWEQQSRLLNLIEFSATKPPAFITIDDRAVNFNGDWLSPIYATDTLRAFKPWNSKE